MEDGKGNAKGFVGKMLNFDKMITPTIIKLIYIVVTVIVMIIGLFVFISGMGGYGSGAQVFLGLILIVSSPFINRIWCEAMIVIFKINENLAKIANGQ